MTSETNFREQIISFAVLIRRHSAYPTLMKARQATKARDKYEQDLSNTIVETVAEAEGVEPTELDACLYDIIDPEALNGLFRYEEDDPKSGGIVSFTFNGYEVDVHSDSSVEIDPVEG